MPHAHTSEPGRHLPLSGTYNVRDIGGYLTQDGQMTRWRTLFRADNLHRLTSNAQSTLLGHGLATVIDLRRSDELQIAPNVFAGSSRVTYRHLSLLVDTPPVPGTPRALTDTYRHILDQRQAQVLQVLRVLATPGALPAVVHCTAGKDRTGVIVALLLGLAGVAHETIIADYALTARYLTDGFIDGIRQRALQRGYTWEQYAPLVQCPPAFMHDTLHELQVQYGGLEAYIRHIGLNTAEIEHLRSALVT
jgi:protein-tyrosine phosphatase